MTHEEREIHRKKRILEHSERIGNITPGVGVVLHKRWQRLHIEGAAIRIVRIDDDHDRGVERNLQTAKVECEVSLWAQWGLRASFGNLGEKAVGARQQVSLLAEAFENLPQDQLRACIDVDRRDRHTNPLADQLTRRRRIRLRVVVASR